MRALWKRGERILVERDGERFLVTPEEFTAGDPGAALAESEHARKATANTLRASATMLLGLAGEAEAWLPHVGARVRATAAALQDTAAELESPR